MSPGQFRFDAKNVFLTYANSGDLTKERLRDFLLEDLGCRWFHISRESHSDGRPHLHAYAGWDGRHRSRDERHFDCAGQHPNITIPRNIGDVRKYISKDGDFLTNCDGPDFDRDSDCADGWGELLTAETREAFMDGARRKRPRDYVLSYERLEYFCDKHFGRKVGGYSGRERGSFCEPLPLERWVFTHWEVRVRGGPSPLPTNTCAYPLMPIGLETETRASKSTLIGGRN